MTTRADDKRVAVITGSAGGIGAATAIELAARGYDLAITDIDAERLQAVARRVGESTSTSIRVGDLADLAFVERFIQEAVGEFGRIDALVNNAAWREMLTMREMTVESWERTLRVCLTAPAFLSRAA